MLFVYNKNIGGRARVTTVFLDHFKPRPRDPRGRVEVLYTAPSAGREKNEI